jgi:hypothetical protein
MLLVICSNGDGSSASYKQAEQAFVKRLYAQKASSIPNGTNIKTFSNPKVTLPNVNDQMSTQIFLSVLLNKMNIDPYEAKLSWKAELYKEFGYTFVTFYLTPENPSFSFGDINTSTKHKKDLKDKPKASGFRGFLNKLFGKD